MSRPDRRYGTERAKWEMARTTNRQGMDLPTLSTLGFCARGPRGIYDADWPPKRSAMTVPSRRFRARLGQAARNRLKTPPEPQFKRGMDGSFLGCERRRLDRWAPTEAATSTRGLRQA